MTTPVGLGVVLSLLVVDVMEANGLGQLADGSRPAGEKVPADLRARVTEMAGVQPLLGRSIVRRLTGIDAHAEYIEIAANDHALHPAQLEGQLLEDQAAQHGAAIIAKLEQNGPVTQVIAHLYGTPLLVDEGQIERHLGVQILVEADVSKGIAGSGAPVVSSYGRRREDQQEQAGPGRAAMEEAEEGQRQGQGQGLALELVGGIGDAAALVEVWAAEGI